MSGIEKRVIGILARILLKLATRQELDDSEIFCLENIINIYCKED